MAYFPHKNVCHATCSYAYFTGEEKLEHEEKSLSRQKALTYISGTGYSSNRLTVESGQMSAKSA